MKMNASNENPPRKRGKAKETANKLLGLAGGLLLSHQVGDAKLPDTFKEDENSGKKTENVRVVPAQTMGNEVGAYDPNIKFSNPEEEVAGTEPVAEPAPDVNSESEPSAPGPAVSETDSEMLVVAEKETKKEVKQESKMEAPAMASLELLPAAFGEIIKEVLTKKIEGKASLLNFELSGSGDALTMKAALKVFGSPVGVVGKLFTINGNLNMEKDPDIDANMFLKGTIRKALNENFGKLLDEVKKDMEIKYKEVHPKGIKDLIVDGGNLRVFFK